MDDNELDEFVKWVVESIDDWYIKEALIEKADLWKRAPAHTCGHKLIIEEHLIWNRTGNYVLETNALCRSCRQVVKIDDKRDRLISAVREGKLHGGDIDILKEELGI